MAAILHTIVTVTFNYCSVFGTNHSYICNIISKNTRNSETTLVTTPYATAVAAAYAEMKLQLPSVQREENSTAFP